MSATDRQPSIRLGLSSESLSILSDGAIATSDTHEIVAVNEPFAALVGLDCATIEGQSATDPPWTLKDEHGQQINPANAALTQTLSDHHHRTVQSVELVGVDGRSTWVRLSTASIEIAPGSTGVLMCVADMSQAIQAERNLQHMMFTDHLTDLASRLHITHLVSETLSSLQQDQRVGVLHVDLDGFRTINDTFGPATGDAVLIQTAERLRDMKALDVAVGRVGVDEFLLAVVGEDTEADFDVRLQRIAEEVQRRISRPITHDGLELHLTASVGAARGPRDADTAQELMAAADRAVRASRTHGRNQFQFHDIRIDIRQRRNSHLDRDLRSAAARNELEVYYQPIIDLRRGTLTTAEALVRWHHPVHGPIPPSQFIPTAEATGSIHTISDFVIRTVAKDLVHWDENHAIPSTARVAVNISPLEFNRRGFLTWLESTLSQNSVSPERLELEITEALLVDDLGSAAEQLGILDRWGIRVALDDFGTGYSSLSYLHTLPLHTLKIDRRFIGGVYDERSRTITRTIVSLAHNLGVIAVAEGVENDKQYEFLGESGCDRAQGFLIAPPMPRDAFDRFMQDMAVR